MLSRKCSRDEPVQNNRAFFNAIGQNRKSDVLFSEFGLPRKADVVRVSVPGELILCFWKPSLRPRMRNQSAGVSR